ncbi:fucose permease [Amycolatopsis sulphurea]|uniref:Fucose permease n=1 Tax=Amycolatopsis sulphurea TaxID=76022 RepID=A0A2A9G2C3_9PSEU|nr:MFS transporter [Amycolatopsis sulphurea]PFG56809.1 fucose permease [Amycolatopsis sulphurea]
MTELSPPQARTVARRARAATWIVFALNGFAVGMWVVHIPVVERAAGISHPALGALLLVLGGAALAGMQVAGRLADRFGNHRIVPVAGILLGVALVLPGLAGNWWTLALALLGFGFFNGSLDVAMNAQAVVVERAYSRPIMAAFHAMWSIGGALASVAGAAVLDAGLPAVVSLGGTGLLCALVVAVAGRFLLATPAASAQESTVDERKSPPARLVWLLGLLALAMMLSEGVANDWSALYLRDGLGTSESTAALAYGSFAVAMTVGRFATDRVAAFAGPVAVMRYGSALAALGLTVASASPWVPLSLIGWAVFGLGLSGGVPQLFTAAGNLDTRASGALMARVVGVGYLGLLSGPAIIGGLAHFMPLNVTFVLPIVLCLLGVIFAPALKPR